MSSLLGYMPRPQTYTIASEAYTFLCQSNAHVHQFLQIQLRDLGARLTCCSFISASSYYACYKHIDSLTEGLPIDSIWAGIIFFFPPITLCLFPFPLSPPFILLALTPLHKHISLQSTWCPFWHGGDTTWTEGSCFGQDRNKLHFILRAHSRGWGIAVYSSRPGQTQA